MRIQRIQGTFQKQMIQDEKPLFKIKKNGREGGRVPYYIFQYKNSKNQFTSQAFNLLKIIQQKLNKGFLVQRSALRTKFDLKGALLNKNKRRHY